ncbi:MAG: hypothetical protein IKQ23_08195, partial [Treponema sp.]|nr:hypothetical protein [Treponema sp.]
NCPQRQSRLSLLNPYISPTKGRKKQFFCATGRKIWMKIHLRGATEGSQIPITSHHGFSARFFWKWSKKTVFYALLNTNSIWQHFQV